MFGTKEKLFYDSPESEKWVFRFDVLYLKRDHRRILNAQPRIVEFIYRGKWREVFLMNFEVMSN